MTELAVLPAWRALDDTLLKAHARNDAGALSKLYARAADLAETAGEVDRACFFLTHAWIFALEQGDPDAAQLRARLLAQGRVDPI
jgi:hypothetical protein